MKEKALILIGLNSKKWLSEKLGINPLTLEVRLEKNNWKPSEEIAINIFYDQQKHKV
jgi:hypothetical protein